MPALPLGTVASGPVAEVDDAGRVRLDGRTWTIGWWARSEERWHRPEVDHTTRTRLVDDLPIVETAVRVPSGDVVGTSYAAAGEGGRGEVVLDVRNGSPVPVAVAVVLGPVGDVTLDGDEVLVGGEVALRLGRRPGEVVRAASIDALADLLAAAERPERSTGAFAAVVMPLPHAQRVRLVIGEGAPAAMPEVEQVAAGWATHLDRGATFAVPEPASATARRSVAEAGLGPAVGAPIAEVAAHLRARLHLGWFTAATELTDRVLAARRARGGFGDDATTVAAVAALAGWRLAGLPPGQMEVVIDAVAAGAHRLARRARRIEDHLRVPALDARWEAARFLAAAGQLAAADAARPPAPAIEPAWPTAERGAGAAADVVRALVVDEDDGLGLLAGWTPAWWGAPVDVRDVPTRWGRASYSVRWHGDRPALLWELEPWEDAAPAGHPTRWRAPSIDPDWVGSGRSGEALLRPAAARPAEAPQVTVDHGAGFAVWDPPAPLRPDAGATGEAAPPAGGFT